MTQYKHGVYFVDSDFMYAIYEREEETGRDIVDLVGHEDIDGLYYTRYHDIKKGVDYLVRTTRTIHIGFNDTPAEKVAEVRATVEREGEALASWGVTGRTMHEILGYQLSEQLPEYECYINGYTCKFYKRGATV